ncbi:MAG: SRPBCC domain-containing protein [Chryseolinea sp.]
MNCTSIVTKRIAILAEPKDVWEALTNPELTQKYFFRCKVFSTWKEGDPITFKGRMFLIKKIQLNGRIIKVEPERLLKYTLVNEDAKHGTSTSTVTDELRYVKGETIVSITDDVGQGPGSEKRYERSMKGWDKVLRGLKEVVESRREA